MVLVAPMAAGHYGSVSLENLPKRTVKPRTMVVVAVSLVVAAACLGLIIAGVMIQRQDTSLEQRTSDSFLFKTPTLKSLVGTFMNEQGASKSDIAVSVCARFGP